MIPCLEQLVVDFDESIQIVHPTFFTFAFPLVLAIALWSEVLKDIESGVCFNQIFLVRNDRGLFDNFDKTLHYLVKVNYHLG